MRVTFIVEGDQGFTRTMHLDERATFNYDEIVLELLNWKAGRVLVVGETADQSHISRLSVTYKGADTYQISREFLTQNRSPFTLYYHRQSPAIIYTDPDPGELGKQYLLPVRVIGEGIDDYGPLRFVVVEAGAALGLPEGFLPRVVVCQKDLIPCSPAS